MGVKRLLTLGLAIVHAVLPSQRLDQSLQCLIPLDVVTVPNAALNLYKTPVFSFGLQGSQPNLRRLTCPDLTSPSCLTLPQTMTAIQVTLAHVSQSVAENERRNFDIRQPCYTCVMQYTANVPYAKRLCKTQRGSVAVHCWKCKMMHCRWEPSVLTDLDHERGTT